MYKNISIRARRRGGGKTGETRTKISQKNRTRAGLFIQRGGLSKKKPRWGGGNEKSGSGDFFLIRRPRHLPHYFPFYDIYELPRNYCMYTPYLE